MLRMPTGRGKKPAKSAAPRAPTEHALCPELGDLQEDRLIMSGPEDSPGRKNSRVCTIILS